MPLFRRNVELGAPLKLSAWRKIAIGTWRSAGDPSVYGILDIEIAPALKYIERVSSETGLKLTLTHLTGRVMAEALKRHPEINCVLRFGRLYPRKQVDIFFQVATDLQGNDLSGMTVRDADQKSVAEIAREMQTKVEDIRQKGDPAFKQMKGTMGLLPGFLVSYALTLAGLLTYALNIWTPLLGSPRDPFGSLMITSIGSLGLGTAFAPLVPYSRIPLLIAIGAAQDMPIVQDGAVVVAKIMRLCATFDHRLIDGVHAARMTATVRKIFASPEEELGPKP